MQLQIVDDVTMGMGAFFLKLEIGSSTPQKIVQPRSVEMSAYS